MAKIKSLEDLKKRHQNVRSKLNRRKKANDPESVIQVKVAMATCGIASGAKETMEYFMSEMEKRHIEAVVTKTGCMGYCYAEPTVEVTVPGKDPVVFSDVDTRKADEIIEKYIKKGEHVEGVIPQNYKTIDDK
ncbi:MAG: (2Fe-2S) ferredoxin domain-containing protein [Bacteroidales bacterium]